MDIIRLNSKLPTTNNYIATTLCEFMTGNDLDFNHIMDRLVDIAEEDGRVSDEQTNFLNALQSEVHKFQEAVEDAEGDGFISDDEFHDLVILRDRILNKAMDFSSDSEDINQLIQELFEEINKHELPGMFEDERTDEQEEREDQED